MVYIVRQLAEYSELVQNKAPAAELAQGVVVVCIVQQLAEYSELVPHKLLAVVAAQRAEQALAPVVVRIPAEQVQQQQARAEMARMKAEPGPLSAGLAFAELVLAEV